MKKCNLKLCAIYFLFLVPFLAVSCKKDSSTPSSTGWIASYSNISIGAQDNTTQGNFFKPQTGATVKLENSLTQLQHLGLMFFTESGGANTFLTFPGNGADATTFGTSGIRLFTQANVGINFWPNDSMVTGEIYKSSLTSLEFDNVVTSKSWSTFDQTFVNANHGDEYLSYKSDYELDPSAGKVYLVQFNGLVRAIMCVRNVVSSSASGGSIKFDIIVEGHTKYAASSSAKYIMPPLK
jgi:hypothetical protein